MSLFVRKECLLQFIKRAKSHSRAFCVYIIIYNELTVTAMRRSFDVQQRQYGVMRTRCRSEHK